MQHTLKQIIFTITLLTLFTTPHTHAMLNNIAGTDIILHNDYKYLSLAHGAIAWETGVIRRMYDFGQIFPVYGKDKEGRKVIEKFVTSNQASKLIRLIHLFFYRVPGSTAETDFGATIQLASTDPNVTLSLMAELMAQCVQLQELRAEFDDALMYVEKYVTSLTDEQIGKLGSRNNRAKLQEIINNVHITPWNRNAGELFISKCKVLIQNLQQDPDKETIAALEMHRKVAEKFFALIITSTQALKKLFKQTVVFKSGDVVESFIYQALDECNPHNPNALYPAHTVEMVLLAFIYKKYSQDRTFLKTFYNKLNEQLEEKILQEELTQVWVNDSFKPVTQMEALTAIAKIFSSKNIMHNIDNHLAEFVYDALQIRGFPSPVGYAEVTYEYTKDTYTQLFSDCMENAIRNFINVLAYDAEPNKFTVEKLLSTLNRTKVHPSLIKYVNKFNDPGKASSIEAHEAWIEIIANIPYGNYKRMVDEATKQENIKKESSKGYITIAQDNPLIRWLQKERYLIPHEGQLCYELRASIKNIIIVLDHLLQLNLFANGDNLFKVFNHADFIAEYFPKLCTALTGDCLLSTHANAQHHEENKNFDALDYTNTTIYATIKLTDILCEFATYDGHGEFTLLYAQGSEGEENLLINMLRKLTHFKEQPSISLLVTHILCRRQIEISHLKNDNSSYLYLDLYAMPLENTGLVRSIINNTFTVMNSDISTHTKILIKDLFMRLAQRQPDEEERQDLQLTIMILLAEQQDLLANTTIVEEIKNTAIRAIKNHKKKTRQRGAQLVNVLIENNQAIQETVDAIQAGIVDNDDVIITLFTALFKKGFGFDLAKKIAHKNILQNESLIKRVGLQLCIMLIDKDQVLDDAIIQTAIDSIKSESPGVSNLALQVLMALVGKKQGIAKILALAKEGITNPKSNVGTQVSFALIEQSLKYAPIPTRKVIRSILNNQNISLSKGTEQKLKSLLKQK